MPSRAALATGVIVVAALFVGSTINAALPDPNSVFAAPFEHPAAIGEPVTLRDGIVTVTGLESGREILRFNEVAVTEAVFLVVQLTYEPTEETQVLPLTVLRVEATDGRQYGGQAPISTGCGPTPPGLPIACRAPFELPPDALPGARLLIPAGASTTQMDDVAVIDLGIDEARADALGAATGRVTIPDDTVYVGR